MSTETEVTTTDTVVPTKTTRPKSLVNLRLIAALDQAERYATIAQRPEIAAKLTEQELPPDFTAALLTDTGTCRGFLASFVQATTDRQVHTATERTARTALIVQLQGIQSGAKRKWARKSGERDKLKGYFIGTPLKNRGFAELSEIADTILRQARQDSLPAVKPTDLTALETAIASWKAANEAQAQAQNAATVAHQAADTLAKGILDRRIELQLTADSAFPYHDKANTAIRRELNLPPNGPYSAL